MHVQSRARASCFLQFPRAGMAYLPHPRCKTSGKRSIRSLLANKAIYFTMTGDTRAVVAWCVFTSFIPSRRPSEVKPSR